MYNVLQGLILFPLISIHSFPIQSSKGQFSKYRIVICEWDGRSIFLMKTKTNRKKSIEIFTCVKRFANFHSNMAEEATEMEVDNSDLLLNGESSNGQQNNGDVTVKQEINDTDDAKDDDPVVREIPVFLAKALADQLYLYQVKLIC